MRGAKYQKEKPAPTIALAPKPYALSLECHRRIIANSEGFRSGGLQTASEPQRVTEPHHITRLRRRSDGALKCAATKSESNAKWQTPR